MTSSLCLVGHVALEPRDFLLCAAAVRMRASKSSPGGSNDRAVGKEVGGGACLHHTLEYARCRDSELVLLVGSNSLMLKQLTNG